MPEHFTMYEIQAHLSRAAYAQMKRRIERAENRAEKAIKRMKLARLERDIAQAENRRIKSLISEAELPAEAATMYQKISLTAVRQFIQKILQDPTTATE